jgi:hypothetical protein
MKKIILLFLGFAILPGCEKSNEMLSISNFVVKTRYYDNEIFNELNQEIYGKWQYIYFTNPGHNIDIKPFYEYLEIVKFGIFGLIGDNKIRAIGKVILSKQDNIETIIQLVPDAEYSNYDIMTKKVQFKGNDTLLLSDTYVGGLTVLYYVRAN